MQAAAALGGALRVVVRAGHCGQGLEVVRRAGLVPRLSRQGQSLRQVFCGAAQIAPSLAAERQVVQRDENGQPLGRPTGGGQALGEQPRRGVGISLGEPDLPEEVVYLGDGERQEIRGVPVVRPPRRTAWSPIWRMTRVCSLSPPLRSSASAPSRHSISKPSVSW